MDPVKLVDPRVGHALEEVVPHQPQIFDGGKVPHAGQRFAALRAHGIGHVSHVHDGIFAVLRNDCSGEFGVVQGQKTLQIRHTNQSVGVFVGIVRKQKLLGACRIHP